MAKLDMLNTLNSFGEEKIMLVCSLSKVIIFISKKNHYMYRYRVPVMNGSLGVPKIYQ